MPKVRLQLIIDLDYQSVGERTPSSFLDIIEKKLVTDFRDHLLNQSPWDLEINDLTTTQRIIDPEREKMQATSQRLSPMGQVTAYFSSDGPAVVVDFSAPDDVCSAELGDAMSSINGALREAHHKYVTAQRE